MLLERGRINGYFEASQFGEHFDTILWKTTPRRYEAARIANAHSSGSILPSMTLSRGHKLGAYEVVGLLGAGGMGEVYRARDTNLGRDVALKVLPDAFARDLDRVGRFRREAQVLASLNHPHIASIYGFEDAHAADSGSDAPVLVLELVDGPTLADRLVHGAMTLDDAWPIARQICEALEAAHDHGVVHRDLKPANIKVRSDGTVKVLDFGLAKAFDPTPLQSGVSQSPTLISPAVTQAGVIMGTAAYMSPEQARGRVVDKRADVWAFGCVLYEMLVGARPFGGDDVAETLARVIERQPDWQALERVAPSGVVRVVRRCLQKEPVNRLRDIADARLELHEAIAGAAHGMPPDRASADRRFWWPVIGALAVGVVIGIAAGGLPGLRRGTAAPVSNSDVRLSAAINLPGDALLALDAEAAEVGFDSTLLALSPDGKTLVWVGSSGGTVRLFARQLDSYDVRPLPGTEGALHAFFSPDGRSVGFLTNSKLKTHSFVTGTTTTICDVSTGVVGTWTSGDELFFGAEEGRRLFRVSAGGGSPVLAADAVEGVRYGHVTPDGTSVLVTYRRAGIGADFAQVRLVNLATRETRTLTTDGYDARLTPGNRLVFGRSGRVFAATFDPNTQSIGDPVPIASNVRMHALYPHLQVALSDAGVLAYVPGGDVAVASIAWVDRQGKAEFLPIEPRVYGRFDLSDDGRRLAVQVGDTNDYIVIHDMLRGSSQRLSTTDSAGWPKWSPGGDLLAYTSFGEGKPYRILVQRVDSDRPPVAIVESQGRLTPSTWSPDGRRLTFYEFPGNRIATISIPAEGAAPPPEAEYLNLAASSHDISADGRWLVYTDAGINVRALPLGEQVYKLTDSGTEPKWCRGCNEIVYRSGNRWFSASVRTAPMFDWSPPRMILQTEFNDSPGPSFSLSADGQRILVVKRREERPRNTIHVIHGWVSQLGT
jgi:serine/threonine-protein kinase